MILFLRENLAKYPGLCLRKSPIGGVGVYHLRGSASGLDEWQGRQLIAPLEWQERESGIALDVNEAIGSCDDDRQGLPVQADIAPGGSDPADIEMPVQREHDFEFGQALEKRFDKVDRREKLDGEAVRLALLGDMRLFAGRSGHVAATACEAIGTRWLVPGA